MSQKKLYAERDIMGLDDQGNHYSSHVMAMTAEKLHSKMDIAAELAFRDARIAELENALWRIANPVLALQDDADKVGAKLNGHAVAISNNADMLKDWAYSALNN